ncbi:MAG: hypothetical protein PF795_03305 [Kiritimatiellae bacterium]|jgi:hypothetical protein|nr:hypothetical protein [Kiritimatiellia bacterium]
MKKPVQSRKRILGALCACLFPALAWSQQEPQQAYVVVPGGNQVAVEQIRVRPDGSLVVTINGQPRDISRDQYIRAVGIRPESIDQARALIGQQNGEQAKPILTEIMNSSRYQSWDAMAGEMLANLHLTEENPDQAKQILTTLRERYGSDLEGFFPAIELVDWKTKVATGETAGLEQELTSIIKEDQNRVRKGNAQLVRGDLKVRRKDLQSAVLDYLRTAYFYSDFPDLQAEALYKTAKTFAEIGDTARLRKYSALLKERYPDSRYASLEIGL